MGKAIDLGVTLFDTSEQYGKGRSEEVLGRVVGDRDDVLIATKVAPNRGENETCSADHVVEHAERSLRRLQRSTIDVFQIHNPQLSTLQNSDWADGLDRLSRDGKVRFTAVAIRGPEDCCLQDDEKDVG